MSDVAQYIVWLCGDDERAEVITNAEKFVKDVPYIERLFEQLATKGSLTDTQFQTLKTIVSERIIWGNEDHPSQSEFVGEVGMRQVFRVTINKSNWRDGNYGPYLITTMTDAQGNVISYLGSAKSMFINSGKVVELSAEVEDHNIYRNTRTTRIKNPQILEVY